MSINLVKSVWLRCERWNIRQLLISGRLFSISISQFLCNVCLLLITVGMLIPWSMPPSLLVTGVRLRIQYIHDPGDALISAYA